LIGGYGASGFIGRVAELLFYNRALNDHDRQTVESYLQNRYECMPSASSDTSSESSSESSESSEDSSGEDSSSSSSSSSSSWSSQHSEEGSSDSSESSGSGSIYFTESSAELFNPTATDYDWILTGFVNTTGKDVATVDFAPLGESARSFALAPAAEGNQTISIESEIKNKETLSIKASAWGVDTEYGKAELVGTATFKDSMQGVIANASLGIEVKASLFGMLEESKKMAGLNSSVQLAFSQPFRQAAEGIGFFNQNAPAEIEAGIKTAITGNNAQFKFELNAAIAGLDNSSLKRIVGTSEYSVTNFQGTSVKVSTFGKLYKEVFSPNSDTTFSFGWEGGVKIQGIDNQKIFGILEGIKASAKSIKKNEPENGVSIELNDSGQFWFNLYFGVKE
jgi:hypothetical protein